MAAPADDPEPPPLNSMPVLNPASLIDLERYPLASPETSVWRNLGDHCQSALAADGACALAGFLTAPAARRMAAETDNIASKAFRSASGHNVMLLVDDDDLPAGHPRRRHQQTDLDAVPYDAIPEDHALRRLYEWEPLLHFVAAATGQMPLYRMADPLAALTINVMAMGQNHGWHFDEAEITVTLMLQAPLEGGTFEIVRGLRGADDRVDDDALENALSGQGSAHAALAVSPGTLLLFAGHRTLHRVTPVLGPRPRYVATLSYKSEPGICNSPEVQQLFYGRTAKAQQ